MFSKGDRVTVIDTDEKHHKCCLGRTGTVVQVDYQNNLIAVGGIGNRIVECLIGEPAYQPNQLRKEA